MKINSNDLFFAALYLWLGMNITQAITDLDVLTSAIIATIAIVAMSVYHYAKDRLNVGQEGFLSQIDDLETQIETQKEQIETQKLHVAAQAQKFVSQIANAEEQNENLQEQNDVLQSQMKNVLLQNENEAAQIDELEKQIDELEKQKLELEKTLTLRQEEIENLKRDAQVLALMHERVLSLGWSLERFKSFIFDDYDEAKRKITLSKQIQTSNAKKRNAEIGN
jgi:chromosome segregation ATPase